ncbi:MAG: exosortase/archaeosortase family protein [Rhodopirellula sp.]|nr:exosortase/archaeosortase family protein [Rhodopirellula sp.]
MRISLGVRSRLKMPTVSLCAIAGLVIAWPEKMFSGSLVPIPDSLVSATAGPIAKLTSAGSLYLLETLGWFFPANGGVLQIHDSSVDLVTASGGLRVLIAVLLVSISAAALSAKPVWERLLIAASGLPIAIVCSVMRVTVGSLVLHEGGQLLANLILFDVAGWLTLALAWTFLLVERELLSRLLVAPPEREVVPVFVRADSLSESFRQSVALLASQPDAEEATESEPLELERRALSELQAEESTEQFAPALSAAP